MTEWDVTVAAASGEDDEEEEATSQPPDAIELGQALREQYPVQTAVVSLGPGRAEVAMIVEAASISDAFRDAISAWRVSSKKVLAGEWSVTRVEVGLPEEVERARERANAIPELAGVGDVARILGVSKQRVSALKSGPRFPRPIARTSSGPVWAIDGITAFAARWDRSPGRPRTETSYEVLGDAAGVDSPITPDHGAVTLPRADLEIAIVAPDPTVARQILADLEEASLGEHVSGLGVNHERENPLRQGYAVWSGTALAAPRVVEIVARSIGRREGAHIVLRSRHADGRWSELLLDSHYARNVQEAIKDVTMAD